MYIVSSHRHICSAAELDGIEQQYQVKLPEGYGQFLQQYGQGTYCDWFHVNMPDAERLQQFAEYGLWEHEQDSPITATQLRDCVVIASTVDGDMLALHSDVKGGLWLPRHSEQIMAVSWQELSWQAFMNGELQRLYTGAPTSLERQCYFEPWNGRQQHEFVMLQPQYAAVHVAAGSELTLEHKQAYLRNVAAQIAEHYVPALRLENPYWGKLFYRELEGYVRFNYAYGNEVALFYEPVSEHGDGQAQAGKTFMEIMREQLKLWGIY
ncbi:SMI1/KNR4 family protein [Paenibacillus campi]|uniref:SMI1/KNR4 family protein n=1 Tax=Paenibacillus campi TaxID=3106031 RepID=UPI002AFEDA1F|nr:SMI1/KNR4 family protein [Paenibacillus sp. SGZ-1009]